MIFLRNYHILDIAKFDVKINVGGVPAVFIFCHRKQT